MKKRIASRSEMITYIQKLKSMPDELKLELFSWEEIAGSPYSYSFYSSKKKRWNFTPIGCKRISNHWNFSSKKTARQKVVHCKTDIPVRNHTYWTLAVFERGIWKVIKSLPMK